ncbi:hypothetical protein [Nostoc sp.]|uniref:hypothetical protein n=1 Tax=Nostoc sp. TaxID=1180 RepID=UPI002FF96CDB
MDKVIVCLQKIVISLTLIIMLVSCSLASAQQKEIMVRISEIEIDSNYLNEYKAILKEESEASVRLEAGVISIFPMYSNRQDS